MVSKSEELLSMMIVELERGCVAELSGMATLEDVPDVGTSLEELNSFETEDEYAPIGAGDNCDPGEVVSTGSSDSGTILLSLGYCAKNSASVPLSSAQP
jgi:hypothetical protein